MTLALTFGIFGLIVGSFLNVLILRWQKRPLTGRSTCPSCGSAIAWYDLVPVVSWLMLFGRCRTCGKPISVQYPLVEAGTGIMFALIGLSPLSLVGHLLALPVAALLIAIAAYDLRTTYIPDTWVYAFIALAFVSPFLTSPIPDEFDFVVFILSGPAAAVLLFSIWLVSNGRWMGFGDVKLALGIGYLLGPLYGFVAVMLAFVLGAIVSLTILLPLPHLLRNLQRWGIAHFTLSRSYTMKSEVPFGPFLVVATLIVWIANMHDLSFSLAALLGGLP